ncbi:hypothetical protein O6H91_16G044400 [Diphasiastrum complanatum]|uniref:Uncharacterized protein n=2 Tax=Diphasiastrum complanatum TaxID=34168 RepID=A0ACC2BBV6_DIPCM|nr:hypothetical protein O6H91_16G020100 [Diphasiastrum complanatum]KAJ7527249.1 hypothetical protein O6H91_16G044400 [Diphasiastrum complanatum]
MDQRDELEAQGKLEAWEYNPHDEDHRRPHKYFPNRPVDSEHVRELGVLTWKLDVVEWDKNPLLEKIKMDRGYKYSEIATISPEEMTDFEEKVKGYFKEHMHSQEEIRLILDGGGYWDIRDYDESWIRFRVNKGDLIVLPPGMFHRFTLDEHNYVKALLLYTNIPCRTQLEKSTEDDSIARKLYAEKVLNNPRAIHRKRPQISAH